MHQGFRIYIFCLKSYVNGHRYGSLVEPAKIRQIQLSCLADCFYGHQSRILNKVYSKPLMHALSPCKGPVESNCLGVKCPKIFGRHMSGRQVSNICLGRHMSKIGKASYVQASSVQKLLWASYVWATHVWASGVQK